LIGAVAALAVALVIGWPLSAAIDPSLRGARRAGIAILLGMAASAAILFGLALGNVRWSQTAFLVAAAVIAAGAWLASRGRIAGPGAAGQAPNGVGMIVLLVGAIELVGYGLLATVAPLWEFDFLSDWGLKAKVFLLAKGIDWNFLAASTYRNVHPDYPLLLPMSFDVVALLGGGWDGRWVGLLYPAFATAALLVCFDDLSEGAAGEGNRPLFVAIASLSLVPLLASPWIGIADGPFVALATAALLMIRRALRWDNTDSLTAGAILLGCAAFTKNEGLALVIAAAAGLVVARRGRWILRLWPAVAIPLPWIVLRSIHGLRTDVTGDGVVGRALDHLRNPAPLLDALLHQNLGKPWFWAGMAIGLLLTFRALLRGERFVLTVVVLQLLAYLGAYAATPHDLDWHVRWSWDRLVSHLAPLLAFIVLVQLLEVIGGRPARPAPEVAAEIAAASDERS
jgi:hypothetical protein